MLIIFPSPYVNLYKQLFWVFDMLPSLEVNFSLNFRQHGVLCAVSVIEILSHGYVTRVAFMVCFGQF